MLIKHPWSSQKYVIPVCTNLTCRSRARMNWDGETWRAEEEGVLISIDGNFDSTGAIQQSEVYNDLNNFLGYND